MIQLVKKALAYVGVGIHPRQKRYLLGTTKLQHQQVAGATLLMDRSHSLPFNAKHYPEYNLNIGRLARAVQYAHKDAVMIDVGANIGDTVAYVRQLATIPIICIEGDRDFYSLLKKNISQFEKVSAYNFLLTDSSTDQKFVLAKKEGTASLQEINSHPANAAPVVTLSAFVSDHALPIDNIRLIKIDTDGWDVKILRGASEILERSHPALFFEYDTEFMKGANESGLDAFRLLREKGYRIVLFYDNLGRFMLSSSLEDELLLRQLNRYIDWYRGAFKFFDVCVFHQTDQQLAHKFIESESAPENS
jgi:FkbM family methyltransferase